MVYRDYKGLQGVRRRYKCLQGVKERCDENHGLNPFGKMENFAVF